MTISYLLRFELRYHFARPVTWLYALLIFGQGIWYGLGAHSQFGSRLIWVNSAANAYLVLASPGLILTVVACLVAGQALTKDLEYRVADYAYATPIADRDYFLGKLLGAFLTVLMLALAYPLGTLAVPLLADGVTGPVPVGQLLNGYVMLLIQNLFIIVGIAFSATVFTRRITGAYVVMFAMVLYFLVSNLSVGEALPNDLLLLLDPFGVGMVRDAITQLSVPDKNEGFFSYPAMLFINRVLWMGLSLGLIAQAERQFSFMTFAGRKTEPQPGHKWFSIPSFSLSFPTFLSFSSPLLLLARHEFLGMVKQTAFRVVALFLMLLLVVFATVLWTNPDFPAMLTTARLTALREPLAIYVGLFLMVFSGEIVFRERTVNIWAIYDSLPTSTATTLLAKLLAMIGLAFLLALSLGLAGVSLQLLTGSYPIDWQLYALDLGLGAFLTYVQWIALAFFVAVLVNNRLASHVVSVVLLMGLLLAPKFGYESAGGWLYGWLPGADAYSDLSGYGAFGVARWAFSATWLALAGVFVVLALWGYNRGAVASLTDRWRQTKVSYSTRYEVFTMGFIGLAVSGQLYIGHQQFDNPKHLLAQTEQAWKVQEPNALHVVAHSVRVGDRTVPLTIRCYHPATVALWQKAVANALARGTTLFGAYPYNHLTLTEVPATTETTRSLPGEIRLTEAEGWTADTRQPAQLDYLVYVATREVLNQWTNTRVAPGSGLVQNSLVEYLALQAVKEQFGTDRLRDRLAQRAARYDRHRRLAAAIEPTLFESSNNLTVERDRGALALHSIAEVWGDKPLSLSIGQFFRGSGSVNKPASLTSAAFLKHLAQALPTDYQFLTTYLTERPLFDIGLSNVYRVNEAIIVSMVSQKWTDNGLGLLTNQLPADAVPLVVLDGSGREIYRKIVWPTSQSNPLWLPELPTARTLILDPLGVWPDVQRFNNQKIL
ncbi:MAG: hypothetical protein EAZ91_07625 [Cytophagales bacterium]|nr:MAG: hypothetical protein EAZ91_07625 [Cytophagales bacterium]